MSDVEMSHDRGLYQRDTSPSRSWALIAHCSLLNSSNSASVIGRRRAAISAATRSSVAFGTFGPAAAALPFVVFSAISCNLFHAHHETGRVCPVRIVYRTLPFATTHATARQRTFASTFARHHPSAPLPAYVLITQP